MARSRPCRYRRNTLPEQRRARYGEEENKAASQIFALDLEYAAIKYLQEIREGSDPQRTQIAEVLLEEHDAALQSLWGRINYGQETKLEAVDEFIHETHDQLPEGMEIDGDQVSWSEPLDNRSLECTVQISEPNDSVRFKWLSHKLIVVEPEEDWEW